MTNVIKEFEHVNYGCLNLKNSNWKQREASLTAKTMEKISAATSIPISSCYYRTQSEQASLLTFWLIFTVIFVHIVVGDIEADCRIVISFLIFFLRHITVPLLETQHTRYLWIKTRLRDQKTSNVNSGPTHNFVEKWFPSSDYSMYFEGKNMDTTKCSFLFVNISDGKVGRPSSP